MDNLVWCQFYKCRVFVYCTNFVHRDDAPSPNVTIDHVLLLCTYQLRKIASEKGRIISWLASATHSHSLEIEAVLVPLATEAVVY